MRLFLSLLLFLAAAGFAAEPTRTPAIAEMVTRYQTQYEVAKREAEERTDSVQAHSRLGDLCLFLGKFKESVSAFEKMIEIDPKEDTPHWRLGIAYYFAGEYAKSAKQFEKYHAYDGRDRENGVWKCMAQIRAEGLEKARKEMLVYTRFDREPFPAVYEMFAGKKGLQDVLNEMAEKKRTEDPQVMFFAHYYGGVYEELTGKKEAAREHMRKAVAYFTPETAGSGGPGYMWQVARVHAELLEKP